MDIQDVETAIYFENVLKQYGDPKRSIAGDLRIINQFNEHQSSAPGTPFKLQYPFWKKYWVVFKMRFVYNDIKYMKLAQELESMLSFEEE